MKEAIITMDVESSGPDLRLQIRLDSQVQFDSIIDSPRHISIVLDDDPAIDHVLEIEMSGKLPGHTVMDADGNIVQDRMISLGNVTLDGVKLGNLFYEESRYYHDHNGHGPTVDTEFFGNMGCNGIVRFSFSSPIYLWLLENT